MRFVLTVLVAGAVSLPVFGQSWTPLAKLIPSDARASEDFGRSVALTGGQLLVGVTNTDEMFVFDRVG